MDFFYNNKDLIIASATILINLVCAIIVIVKKTKENKNISISEVVNELLPTLINQAELLFGSKTGETKQNYVLEEIKKITNSKTAVKIAKIQLENILSTPQKKEK